MGLFSKFIAKVSGKSSALAEDWQELERALIEADLGPKLSSEIINQAKDLRDSDPGAALIATLSKLFISKSRSLAKRDPLTVILIVGVNGTGKTTSAAKLATQLVAQGNSVLLGAADTFRAAAVEQLQTWGASIGVEVVNGAVNSDPASVAFDAAQRAQESKVDYLIIDTAGRLQNKSDLMDQLGKIRRVVEKVAPVSEVLLVVDATTGQNGLSQAKIFSEAVSLTGLILTKTDGSAKGGIALSIESELGIAIKFIGSGESSGDWSAFEPDRYIQGLL
ncbi:MAG: signal recognition particle-docking protein FtsY [Actinomycetes bacterium]